MKTQRKMVLVVAVFSIAVLVIGNFVAHGLIPFANGPRASAAPSENIEFSDNPVFVLGVSTISKMIETRLQLSTSKTTFLPTQTLLSALKHERDILFIDGLWLQTVSLRNIAENLRSIILQGTPTVVIAGSPDILRIAIDDVQISQAYTDTPIIAYGLKYYPQTGASSSLNIAGILGEPEHLKTAVSYAYQWSVQYLSNTPPHPEPAHHSPWWQWRYTYTYYSGDFYKPYGRHNIVNDYYRLEEDGSSSYKWYNAHFGFQSVPGYTAYGNDYRTMDMRNQYDANEQIGHSSDILNDYDPTTTSGATTVGVSVGVTAGENGAAVTSTVYWSYTISDVQVNDQSDYSLQLAKWWHDVNENANVGKYTYKVEPGETTRTSETGHYGIYDSYYITWGTWVWDFWPFWGHWETHGSAVGVGGHVY